MSARLLLVLALLAGLGLVWMTRHSWAARARTEPAAVQAAAPQARVEPARVAVEPEPRNTSPAAEPTGEMRAPVAAEELVELDVTWPPEARETLEQRYAGASPEQLEEALVSREGEQATELSRLVADMDERKGYEELRLPAGANDSPRTSREGKRGREHLGFSMQTPREDGSKLVRRYWIAEADQPRWTELERERQWLAERLLEPVRVEPR